ncbi:hypothetical protein V1Y59_02770 [Gordonia sp. PKS22-38]|uniref:FHA domain-containing protein n=1 Tax=Gordonia prachuapensis TaxID=3115651 RepID=A0ABU7MNT0_9ACTN|nr:hypothetical protein [Gordonia sp. PKS22-38]
MRVTVTETIHFGEIEVVTGDSATTATYLDDQPLRVTVRRPGPRTDTRIPIGTRDGAALAVDIDGRPVAISAGRARLTSKSYEIRATFDDSRLVFRPKDMSSSELVSESAGSWNNRLGDITRLNDGSVLVVWRQPFTVARTTIAPPLPSREQALVAVAIGSAIGTGGLSMTTILASAFNAMFD